MKWQRIVDLLIVLSLCLSFLSCDKGVVSFTESRGSNEVIEKKDNVQNGENIASEEVSGNNINKTEKRKVLDDIESLQMSALVVLDYASKEKVIIHGNIGLIVYDLKDKKVTNAINLQELDMNHMQGDILSVIRVQEEGTKILMFNDACYINQEDRKKNPCDDKSIYLYDVENDSLKKTNNKTFDNEYNGIKNYEEIKTYDNKYLNKHKNMECLDYKYIDESNICFLLHPTKIIGKDEGISKFKILIVNTESDKEKIYDIKARC